MKKSVFSAVIFLGASLVYGEGRWHLTEDKKTGEPWVVLETTDKVVVRSIPLAGGTDLIPVGSEELLNKKDRERAQRKGWKFYRRVEKTISATPLRGGRELVLQEQTVIWPPQSVGEKISAVPTPISPPAENTVLVTIFDEGGITLWSRRFGAGTEPQEPSR